MQERGGIPGDTVKYTYELEYRELSERVELDGRGVEEEGKGERESKVWKGVDGWDEMG